MNKTISTFLGVSLACFLSACGGGGGGGGSAPPPGTYSITGTVTGPYVEGVTITRTGGATAVTNASGSYSFTGLPAGSYTLTPSLPGYNYSPASPTVAITSADAVQNFAAASAITSYSISGTVSYAGAKTGRVGLTVVPASCTGTGLCSSTVAGTNIAAPGAYTIRGLPPGSYIVRSRMDYLGTQVINATSPYGFSSTVTVVAADVTGADITLADQAGPFNKSTPTNLKASPANGSALILWDPVVNANDLERVTAYKIYWGTDVNATTGTPIVVGARGDDVHYFQSGLTDGDVLYYKIASCVDDLLCTSGAGTASAVVGPVTIGATTGTNTVSGTVTFPGTATGPLMVVVYDDITSTFRFTRIPTPVSSPQAYSIAGVPSGSYGAYVALDMDNNGVASIGDLTYDLNSPFTVSANTTQNFTLSSASGSAHVSTHHSSNGTESYGLQLEADNGTKHIVSVALVSGLNVAVPFDIGRYQGEFDKFVDLSSTRPTAGDAYVFKVTFSDGTTETLTGSVSAVLDAFATNLVALKDGTGGSSPTIPLFTWAAPTSPPAFYTYGVSLQGTDGTFWYMDTNLPSTTFSTLYDSDGNASGPLTATNTYTWQVSVEDANFNRATLQAAPYVASP
jgi:hypothetical protein